MKWLNPEEQNLIGILWFSRFLESNHIIDEHRVELQLKL